MTKAPVEQDEVLRGGEPAARRRALRTGNLGAAVLTTVMLVVMGLGLQIGVAAGERDPDPPSSASTTTPSAPSSSSSTSTTTAPEIEILSAELSRVAGRDGDLSVTLTVATDPEWPGAVAVRVEANDPTGTVTGTSGPLGPGAVVRVTRDGQDLGEPVPMGGDADPGCDGVDPAQAPTPGALDERHTLTASSGPATVSVTVVSAACSDQPNTVELQTEITFS